MGADDRHNPGSPVESLYSFNRHLLSAGCVLGPTSGYGSKLIETSKTPTSLVLLLQWRENLKRNKDRPHEAVHYNG